MHSQVAGYCITCRFANLKIRKFLQVLALYSCTHTNSPEKSPVFTWQRDKEAIGYRHQELNGSATANPGKTC